MIEKALFSAPTDLCYYPSLAIMKPWADCSTSLSLDSLDCSMGLIMQVLKKCYFPSPLPMSLCLGLRQFQSEILKLRFPTDNPRPVELEVRYSVVRTQALATDSPEHCLPVA